MYSRIKFNIDWLFISLHTSISSVDAVKLINLGLRVIKELLLTSSTLIPDMNCKSTYRRLGKFISRNCVYLMLFVSS